MQENKKTIITIDKKTIKKFLLYSTVALLISTTLIFLDIKFPQIAQSFDGKIRDYMFLLRGKVEPKNDVVIIDVDEKSLTELGQWP